MSSVNSRSHQALLIGAPHIGGHALVSVDPALDRIKEISGGMGRL